MSNVTTGYGAQIWLKVGAGALTKVGELIALEPGAHEWDVAETTNMESAGRVRTFMKSLANPGTGQFQINWMPGDTSDDLITAAVNSTAACEYKIVYGEGTTTNPAQKEEGDVLVLSRTPTIPLDDRMTCTVTLQFTGARDALAAA